MVLSRDADNTAHLISRARCAINRFLIAALRDHGLADLAPSHGDIIAGLFTREAMTMSELARRINRDPSTVTTLVHKLVREGYVTFRENPDDARSRLVMLTDAGRALSDDFGKISSQLAARIWNGIDDQARRDFRVTLRRIIDNFEDPETEPSI